MPLGILILLAQIGCAVHVVRTGRPYFWIFIEWYRLAKHELAG